MVRALLMIWPWGWGQPSLPSGGDNRYWLLGDEGWGLPAGFPMEESFGEHCGLRKADIVDGLPEGGAVSIHCGPGGPPILAWEAPQ